MLNHAPFRFATDIYEKDEIPDSMLEGVNQLADSRVYLNVLKFKLVRQQFFCRRLASIGIIDNALVQTLDKL